MPSTGWVPVNDRQLLSRHPVDAAPLLLGAHLTSRIADTVTIRITEVEAYAGIGQDPGSHAHRRRTRRNASMFGAPGHAYVYFTYGMHWCVNVVAHPAGEAGAVLIRAGEVVEGIGAARLRRPAARTDRDLARGPARLAAALGVTGMQDGTDLLDPGAPLTLTGVGSSGPQPAPTAGTRTGISGAGADLPWRFWLPGEPTVSPHRPVRT